MSFMYHHVLIKRGNHNTTFTIVFVIVATVVVAACAFWGFIIPRWRKKHPARPSRTKWNDGSILTRRSSQRVRRAFPAHPAINPLLSKPSAAQILPTYNPRVESPFPHQPPDGMSTLLALSTRTCSAPPTETTISSNGLFTPVKGDSEGDRPQKTFHTVPRAAESRHLAAKSVDFGDAKDFILAVPEPLTLRPRPAGRPPAVACHLEKFGTPHTHSPAASDKLPHPNKLFQAIQQGDLRTSFCSSTSMRIDHRASDVAAASDVRGAGNLSDEEVEKDAASQPLSPHNFEEARRSNAFSTYNEKHPGFNESATALHRLRSYKSLTGENAAKLCRAGTLTRPKTPVNELSRCYSLAQSGNDITQSVLPHVSTKSTLPTAGENSSDIDSVSTPATTPPLPQSQLDLLPRRLRPHKSGGRRMLSTKTDIGSAVSVMIDESQYATTAEAHSGVISCARLSRGFYQPGRRSKPAPPTLKTDLSFVATKRQFPRRSLTDTGPSTDGSAKKTIPLALRARASSMYSGEAYGLMSVPSPSTTSLSSSRANMFSDHNTAGNPFTGRESVRTRIEEWHQRIDGLVIQKLPASQPLTPLPQPTDMREVTDQDSFEVVGQQIKQSPCTSVDDLSLSNLVDQNGPGSAPGGATWI